MFQEQEQEHCGWSGGVMRGGCEDGRRQTKQGLDI